VSERVSERERERESVCVCVCVVCTPVCSLQFDVHVCALNTCVCACVRTVRVRVAI
jgi:hypothetical protein